MSAVCGTIDYDTDSDLRQPLDAQDQAYWLPCPVTHIRSHIRSHVCGHIQWGSGPYGTKS